MTKVIWLSDLHFVATGLIEGHDPRRRVSLAVDYVNAHHGDAACCVISGDLVDRATTQDYAALRAYLDRLSIPVLPMVGNHDDRDLLRATWSLPAGMADFVQYAVPQDGFLLICLDTLTPGAGHGSFCTRRMAWLQRTLAEHSGTATVIFMHHPPIKLGLPMQDQDRLLDSAGPLETIAEHDQIRHLCCGHVHRPVTGSVNGIGFTTMRSVLYQAPPPVPAWDWNSFAPAKENPALGVMSLQDGDVRIQFAEFCAYSDGVTSDDQSPSG